MFVNETNYGIVWDVFNTTFNVDAGKTINPEYNASYPASKSLSNR
jgi:hypothetical protein